MVGIFALAIAFSLTTFGFTFLADKAADLEFWGSHPWIKPTIGTVLFIILGLPLIGYFFNGILGPHPDKDRKPV